MVLCIGNVVQVVNRPSWRFNKKYGKVVEVVSDGNKNGSIGVRFFSWYRRLFDYPSGLDTVVRFVERDLVRCYRHYPFDMTPEEYCGVLFLSRKIASEGRFHLDPLVPGMSECEYKGCNKKATLSILVNVLGVVREFDVCPDHTSDHGKNVDSFPSKS